MPDLKNILESFCKLEGVRGALIVDDGGAIRERASVRDFDAERIARLVDASGRLGRRTATALDLDAVGQSHIEFEGFSVTSETVADRSLVVVADAGANLGRIRLEIRKSKKMIEGA